MTDRTEPPTEPRAIPLPLRVAAGLCAAVGVLSVFGALAVSLPVAGNTALAWIRLGVNMTAALLMCLAAVLVWMGRKLGVAAVVLAWVLPTTVNVLAGQSIRAPSLLMILALITLAVNWQLLH